MPHVIVEYSDNLSKSVDLQKLADDLHDVAIASGLMDLAALRTRFSERHIYRIADRHPENSFMHIVARMREGRDKNDLRAFAQSLLTVAREALESSDPGEALCADRRNTRNHPIHRPSQHCARAYRRGGKEK